MTIARRVFHVYFLAVESTNAFKAARVSGDR